MDTLPNGVGTCPSRIVDLVPCSRRVELYRRFMPLNAVPRVQDLSLQGHQGFQYIQENDVPYQGALSYC